MKKLLPKFTAFPLLILLLAWTTAGVLPIFDQSIIASKFLFMIVTTLIVLITYLAKSLKNGLLSIVKSPFTLPALIWGIVTLVSIFANNKFPVESLLGFGGVFLSFSILIGLGSNLIKSQPENNNKLMIVLAGLSITLAITTALQHLGYGPIGFVNKLLGLNLPNGIIFNLSGSILVALQFTLVTIVGFATKALITKKTKPWENLTLIISTLASLFYGWFLLPGKISSPIILSPTASWSVAMSSMTSLKNALIGVGPNNYIKAFNLYKPQWLNNDSLWNIQFTQAVNLPLTILVTLGIFGLIAWLLIATAVLKQSKQIHTSTKPIHAMLIATLLIQLLLPINIVIIVFQAILIIFWVASERDRFLSYNLNLNVLISKIAILKKRPEVFSRIIISLAIMISVGLLYLTLQASYSSFLMYKASKAASANDFVSAYSFQQNAIKLNPYLDSSRRKYAITNIIIAAAISQKTDLTEEDKERFATLIQQAIREGKATIFLDSTDIANRQTLAQVYQTLIGVADNSEEWAIKSYIEASKLAPNDPQLRVTIGGVFFNSKDYGRALTSFSQAATLKPNYANAYYNAANTYKALNNFEDAKIAYQKTLILLQPDSEEYLKASDELLILEEMAKKEIEKQTEQQPEENPTPIEPLTPIENVTPSVEEPPQTEAAPETSEESAT